MASLRNPPFIAIQELKDDFESLFTDTAVDLKSAPVPDAHFNDDPLALSVTSYLIWQNNPHRRWVPVTEVGRPTPEAREMAYAIRKYYLQRNTMKLLKGIPHTEFQIKMDQFLSDIRPLKMDELGLLYRIPYFYQEDLQLDKIFEGAVNVESDNPGLYSHTIEDQLTPVQEVFRSRKSGDMIQFWFSNGTNERLVFDVKSDNKLISVFRSLFRQPKLGIKAITKMEALPGSHIRTRYWRLASLELE